MIKLFVLHMHSYPLYKCKYRAKVNVYFQTPSNKHIVSQSRYLYHQLAFFRDGNLILGLHLLATKGYAIFLLKVSKFFSLISRLRLT